MLCFSSSTTSRPASFLAALGLVLATAGAAQAQTPATFAPVSTYPDGGSPYGVAVANMNGDGRLDIVTTNFDGDAVGVLPGLASGSFAATGTSSAGVGSGPRGVALADLNGDGRPDIITANYGSNTVGVLLNTGTFTPLAAASATTAAEVTLFPNPARDGFAVRLPAAWGATPVRAELLNALGQVVAVRAVPAVGGATLAVETTGLNAGIYTLRLHAAGHTLAKRVAIE